MVSEDCAYCGRRHQDMRPSQTLNLTGDERRRMITTGQPSVTSHCMPRDGFMTDRWAETSRQNSVELVPPTSQQLQQYGQYNRFDEHPHRFDVSDRHRSLEQTSSCDHYLYGTSFDGISDRQRVTAVWLTAGDNLYFMYGILYMYIVYTLYPGKK